MTQLKSLYVAVIGAGAAGMVASRELRREGHKVVVFERSTHLGGTWVYTPESDSDPLGSDPDRTVIHSSLYASLRTNLPREVMGFTDYPFTSKDEEDGRDPRRFPGHREVLVYLQDFAKQFQIEEMVRFETELFCVDQTEDGKWRVRSKRMNCEVIDDEVFDAVVVCNGHYTQPRIADIPGISSWPGKQFHSHNYRIPEPFRDQIVVIVGNGFSTADICRDISGVAKEVHIAARYVADIGTCEKLPGHHDNIWLHSMVESVQKDGIVIFENGYTVLADTILHCTGYEYCFPFLKTNGIVTVDDNRVGPLYKHIFPPSSAPSLSFIGIPWRITPFPFFEFQSKWVAAVLSGRVKLPSQEEMKIDVENFYSKLAASDTPKRYTHYMLSSQYEYVDWIGAQCGCCGMEEWRKQMNSEVKKNQTMRPDTYRDEWDDHDLVLQAHKDFAQIQFN